MVRGGGRRAAACRGQLAQPAAAGPAAVSDGAPAPGRAGPATPGGGRGVGGSNTAVDLYMIFLLVLRQDRTTVLMGSRRAILLKFNYLHVPI